MLLHHINSSVIKHHMCQLSQQQFIAMAITIRTTRDSVVLSSSTANLWHKYNNIYLWCRAYYISKYLAR
jgi:hypothetical protein